MEVKHADSQAHDGPSPFVDVTSPSPGLKDWRTVQAVGRYRRGLNQYCCANAVAATLPKPSYLVVCLFSEIRNAEWRQS